MEAAILDQYNWWYCNAIALGFAGCPQDSLTFCELPFQRALRLPTSNLPVTTVCPFKSSWLQAVGNAPVLLCSPRTHRQNANGLHLTAFVPSLYLI